MPQALAGGEYRQGRTDAVLKGLKPLKNFKKMKKMIVMRRKVCYTSRRMVFHTIEGGHVLRKKGLTLRVEKA